MLRIVGQAPLGATRYELDKLRCNLCGDVFTAPPPEQAGCRQVRRERRRHDRDAQVWQRLPVPSARGHATPPRDPGAGLDPVGYRQTRRRQLAPVHEELIRCGAQGELMHNDDTTMKVLELMCPDTRREAFAELSPQRSGVFTSGDRLDTRTTHHRAVLHRRQARRGEPRAGAHATRLRTRPAHPDVRCPVAQCLARVRYPRGQLQCPRETQVRRTRPQLPRRVSSGPRDATRSLQK